MRTCSGTSPSSTTKKGDKAKAEAYKKEFQAKGGKVLGETYNKGVEAVNAGDAVKAAQLFEQAVKEDPNDADAQKNWAVALAQLNKPAEAISHLQTYLKLRPNADDTIRGRPPSPACSP